MVVCGRFCGRLRSFAVVFAVVCGRLWSFVVVCGRCGRLRSFLRSFAVVFVVVCGRFCGRLRSLRGRYLVISNPYAIIQTHKSEEKRGPQK